MPETIRRHGWEWARDELEAAAGWEQDPADRALLMAAALDIARTQPAAGTAPAPPAAAAPPDLTLTCEPAFRPKAPAPAQPSNAPARRKPAKEPAHPKLL